jgi:hypothetical protein
MRLNLLDPKLDIAFLLAYLCYMKARISKKGYSILANTRAARSLLQAILENGDKLMSGESVEFDFVSPEEPNGKRFVQLVSSSGSY